MNQAHRVDPEEGVSVTYLLQALACAVVIVVALWALVVLGAVTFG